MDPLAYFLTWTTYGTWLHGDDRLSVDRKRGHRPTRILPPNANLQSYQQSILSDSPVVLSLDERRVVQTAIEECCNFRGWSALATNVRSNHVHCVVHAAGFAPERILSDLKARATKRLREAGMRRGNERIWTERGSTRWLNNDEGLRKAMDYVLNHQ